MKKLKKLLSIVLAVAMVLSLVVVTNADEPTTYTLTIDDDTDGYTYTAYQIFTGDLDDSTGSLVLTNIKWGSNVDTSRETELYTALAAIHDSNDYYPFTSGGTALSSAADVAAALASYDDASTDNVVAQQFAEVIENYITGAGTQSGSYNSTNKCYTISDLEAGYYLVKTTVLPNTGYENGDNGAYTRYLLSVVGDSKVESKKDVPSVDKDLDKVDVNIGDTVTYYITATLPDSEDLDDYDAYKLVFHDTLSKGLTFTENSVKVYAFTNTAYNYDSDSPNLTNGTEVNTSCYDVSELENNADGSNTFTVTLTDILSLTDTSSNSISVDGDSQIVVVFGAVLNSEAVIGGDGNQNEVYLEYSNNPNPGGEGKTGTTPKDLVVTWTYELDVTKVDGANANTKLENAQFVLYRLNGDTKEYVVIGSENKVTGWTGNTYDSTETDKASVLTSGNNGLFKVIGLDAGTYYLEEINAPAGYNKLTAPVKLVIDATYTKTDNGTKTDDDVTINTLTIKVGEKEAVNGNTTGGTVSAEVENNKGSSLPSTGGIGTTIFYVVGGVLVLGAVVLLITRKRLGSED